MSMLPEPDFQSSDKPGREYLCDDSQFATDHPAIYEYLARVLVRGHNRAPSRLVVYYEADQACLLLTDPYTGKILFHTSDTVEEALESLDKRLAEPPVKGWKNDKRGRRS